LTKDEIKLARRMRRDGSNWNDIASSIGRRSPDGIRRRLDPEYWLRRNTYQAARKAASKVFA
jgi:hypothetical protein